MEKEIKYNFWNYKILFLMLFISFLVMYFVMFFNADSINHVYLNLTRLYMTFLMICPMVIIMLAFMRKMYTNEKLNTIIVISVIIIFLLTLTLLRIQTPIRDEQFMKAMILHHSSAIMTSQQANIQDPKVHAHCRTNNNLTTKRNRTDGSYLEKIRVIK